VFKGQKQPVISPFCNYIRGLLRSDPKPVTSLRSLDAIHLAIASSEGATLVTADEVLATSGELLAVDVTLLGADYVP